MFVAKKVATFEVIDKILIEDSLKSFDTKEGDAANIPTEMRAHLNSCKLSIRLKPFIDL